MKLGVTSPPPLSQRTTTTTTTIVVNGGYFPPSHSTIVVNGGYSPPSHSTIVVNGGYFPPSLLPLHQLHFSSLSLRGTFNKRGCHLKQYNSFRWSTDAISTTRFSCVCFFGGNRRKETNNKGWLQEISTKKSHLQGHWTTILLATIALIYTGQIATEGELMWWGAKINDLIDDGEVWRLVTSSFLHADIVHLMVNCYSLYSVGPTAESLYGPRRFLTIYLTSAVTSAIMSYWLSEASAVGASGAIFGLVGSIAVFSMKQRGIHGTGAKNLQHIVAVLALNMVIGLLLPGIDNWGHVGGLLGGATVSWIISPE